MKVHNEDNKLEVVGGELVSTAFRIKASAASFQILSAGLYSNRILAIVRELSCNAYDAHKAVGKESVPFELHLPTTLAPFFTIKDFGTGLTHQQVMTIYTTYFESTKTDSDDFIGQLGLGSKSPFSYTNQFTVISRIDGVANSYSMHIGEEGTPAVSHLGSTETDEENGLTITLHVKQPDFYSFRDAAQKALVYFDPYPTIIGDHVKEQIKYHARHDKWAIRADSKSHRGNIRVIQGFVQYPLDTNQLVTEDDLSDDAKSILTAPLDLFVPIGMVQVAPSREHLSYDKRTVANLVKFLNEVTADIGASLAGMVENSDSLFGASCIVADLVCYDSPYRNLYQKLISRTFNIKYNDVDITHGIDLRTFPITCASLRIIHVQESRWRRGYSTSKTVSINDISGSDIRLLAYDYNYHMGTDTQFVLVDSRATKTALNDFAKRYPVGTNIFVFTAPDKNTADVSGDFKAVIDYLGVPSDNCHKTSDLIAANKLAPLAPRAPRATTSTKGTVQIYNHVPDSTGRHFTSSNMTRKQIDFDAGGLYSIVSGGDWKTETLDVLRGHTSVMKILLDLGVITEDECRNMVIINHRSAAKYKKHPEWINVHDMFVEYVLRNKHEIFEVLKYSSYDSNTIEVYNEVLCHVPGIDVPSFIKAIDATRVSLCGEIACVFDWCYGMIYVNDPDRTYQDIRIAQEYIVGAYEAAHTDIKPEHIELLCSRYPLISACYSSYNRLCNVMAKNKEAFIEYINLINSKGN